MYRGFVAVFILASTCTTDPMKLAHPYTSSCNLQKGSLHLKKKDKGINHNVKEIY